MTRILVPFLFFKICFSNYVLPPSISLSARSVLCIDTYALDKTEAGIPSDTSELNEGQRWWLQQYHWEHMCKSKDMKKSNYFQTLLSPKLFLQTWFTLHLKLCLNFIKYIFILLPSCFYDPFYRKKKFPDKWCSLAVSLCSVPVQSPLPCSLGSVGVIFWLCLNCCPSSQLWFPCGFPLTPLAIPFPFFCQPPLSLPGLYILESLWFLVQWVIFFPFILFSGVPSTISML